MREVGYVNNYQKVKRAKLFLKNNKVKTQKTQKYTNTFKVKKLIKVQTQIKSKEEEKFAILEL